MSAAPIRTPDHRLRVFVSSTLGELSPERSAVRQAVDSLRLTPVMFELGARPHPPRELYRAYLEQSHVFLGLYWQGYGWVAPGEEISGIEDEFRLAGDRPRLLYVKEPAPEREQRLKGLLQELQTDNRASYKRFETVPELSDLVRNDLALLLTERFEAANSGASTAPATKPEVEYAQTPDGVSIAFWTLAQGPPLISMPSIPFSHLNAEGDDPELWTWYRLLARKLKLVRYDGRGTGLSQREPLDFSLDAQVKDLETVTDRLGLDRFALFAQFLAGPVAIAYAVRHPERVSHMIFWHSFARPSSYIDTAQVQGVVSLLPHDWEMFSETLAHYGLGWSSGERAARYAGLIRQAVTPDGLQAALTESNSRDYDVEHLLPQLSAPALVLLRRDFAPSGSLASRQSSMLDAARRLASHIPDARLALLDGDTGAPYAGDGDAVVRAIYDFIGEDVALP